MSAHTNLYTYKLLNNQYWNLYLACYDLKQFFIECKITIFYHDIFEYILKIVLVVFWRCLSLPFISEFLIILFNLYLMFWKVGNFNEIPNFLFLFYWYLVRIFWNYFWMSRVFLLFLLNWVLKIWNLFSIFYDFCDLWKLPIDYFSINLWNLSNIYIQNILVLTKKSLKFFDIAMNFFNG